MRGVSGRFSRLTRTLAALGFLASGVLMLLAPAGAQTGGAEGSYAKLSVNGWWEKKPGLPTIPATGLGVAAENGADTKVAALGIDMFVSDDELLSNLTLVLKESTEPGSNVPPITAESQAQPQTKLLVVACPIISIWTPEDGADKAANPPVADCDLARGDGERNHTTGEWRFDITSLAELWVSDTIDQNGVLIIERVNAPLSFQRSFQDLSTGTPALLLETMPVEEEPEEELTEEEFEEFVSGGTDTGATDDSFFDAVGSDVTGTSTTPFGITDTPPTTAPSASKPEPDPVPAANNRTPTKGSLPLGTLALLPLALGLALLFGVVLGPAGDPATVRHREGGLSRALNRRSATQS